jgi:DNA-binding response OmpR family regulator
MCPESSSVDLRKDDLPVPTLRGKPLILLIEDDEDFRDFVCGQLNRDRYQVVSLADGAEAVSYLEHSIRARNEHQFPDLLITDFRMPGNDGLDVLTYSSLVPTILMTAFPSVALCDAAKRLGAAYVFEKPFVTDDLRTAIRVLID